MDRLAVFSGFATAAGMFAAFGNRGWAIFALLVGVYFLIRPNRHPQARLDPERFFSEADKQTLFARANGRCQNPDCGVEVHREFACPLGECPSCSQADHKYPHSKGGRTVLSNGQTLCRRCNGEKGAKV